MALVDRTAECEVCNTVIEASVITDADPIFCGPDASDADEILSAVVLRYDADGAEVSRTAIHWPTSHDLWCDCGAIGYDTIRNV